MVNLYLTAGKSLIIDFYGFGMLPIIIAVLVILAIAFMIVKHAKR